MTFEHYYLYQKKEKIVIPRGKLKRLAGQGEHYTRWGEHRSPPLTDSRFVKLEVRIKGEECIIVALSIIKKSRLPGGHERGLQMPGEGSPRGSP